MKFFILFMAISAINAHTIVRQNWNWTPGQFVTGNPIENIVGTSLTPPTPPPIPTIDVNASLDSLINQLNNLISLRNERRRQVQEWRQNVLDREAITGVSVPFDEVNLADDPWDVVISRLIKALVAVIIKVTADLNTFPLNLLPFV